MSDKTGNSRWWVWMFGSALFGAVLGGVTHSTAFTGGWMWWGPMLVYSAVTSYLFVSVD